MNKVRVAVLADIYKKYSKTVSLSLFNTYMRDLNLPAVEMDELNRLVAGLAKQDTDSELLHIYNNVKKDQLSLKDVVGGKSPIIYDITTEQGDNYELRDVDLDKIIALKNKFIAKNGNIPWGKIKKMCKQSSLEFEVTPEFLRLLDMREADLKQLPKTTQKSSDELIGKLFENETAKLDYHTREIQNEKREYNKLRRELNDDLIWRKQILKAIPDKINLIVPHELPIRREGSTLVVCLSDLHIGLKTKDYDLAKLKMDLVSYVADIEAQVKKDKVAKIEIVGLGDFIEGAYLHATQLHELEFDFGEQVATAIQVVLDFIGYVRQIGLPTSFVAISGNHDRSNGANKKDNLLGDSIAVVISEVVKANAEDLDITYLEPTTKIRHVQNINGTTFAFVHGDADRVQNKDIIAKLSNFFDAKIDTVVAGHLHSYWVNNMGKNQFILQSSSAFNGNSYSDGLGVRSQPGQFMIEVDTKGNVTPIFETFE